MKKIKKSKDLVNQSRDEVLKLIKKRNTFNNLTNSAVLKYENIFSCNLRDLSLHIIAGDGSGSSKVLFIKKIPKHFYTNEFFMAIIENSPLNLEFVPLEFKTQELVELAAVGNGRTLKFIPEEMQTLELCKKALTRHPFAIDDVKNITKELIEFVISVRPNAYFSVPKHLQTDELNLQVIRKRPFSLIDIDNPSRILIFEAIKLDPDCLDLVDNQDIEMCLFALEQGINAYKYVKICANPTHEITLANLLKMKQVEENKKVLIKKMERL